MKRLVPMLGLITACASADNLAPVDAMGGSPDASARRDAGITSVDATMADAMVSTNTCMSTVNCINTAQMLGTVSGDTGNTKLTASGYQSAWFRVRVTEDESGSIGLTLRVAAKLTSPAGAGFDTFVYVNAGSDVLECSTTTGTVTTSGNLDQVRAEWGEGIIPNGLDDDRTVSIEVRPTGTACSAGQMWSLEVEGNWP